MQRAYVQSNLIAISLLSRHTILTNFQIRMSDAYHTNYVLSGLSSAQHLWTLALPLTEPTFPVPPSPEPVANPPEWSVLPLYVEEKDSAGTLFNQADRVRPIQPVYALPQEVVDAIRGYFFIVKGEDL